MGKRPGVMLYFDTRPCLQRLTMDERGALFEAILDYGEYGLVPELEGMVGVAWDFIRPRLDRDAERYEELSQKRSSAACARWEKHHANASDAMHPMPTTTSTTKTTSSSSSSSTPASNPRQDGLSREMDFNERRRQALESLKGLC